MNEAAIKVIARLTPPGGAWPVGAWVAVMGNTNRRWLYRWRHVGRADYDKHADVRYRWPDELSELEANALGIYRHNAEEVEHGQASAG
jgi:hypothetical protein